MTLGQLAAAEQVKPPTMTRIVNALEDGGLAKRVADTGDARRVQIRATPKGMLLLQAARERRIGYLADHLGTLSEHERSTLGQAVESLEKVLRRWE